MIGWGDEEKGKKARNIITYVVIGISIMWLAYSIVTLIVDTVSWRQISSSTNLIPTVSAYTESENDTFREYQTRLRTANQNLEIEYRVNGSVSTSNIQNLKNLVQLAYDRLPDNSRFATENSTAKNAVDMYLDIAIKNPSASNRVYDAISKVNAFIEGAKIETITGDISASPGEWNSPLTVSFRANNIKDPSGVTPDNNNYIWWMRTNGNYRQELWRGPTLTYTFTQEWTQTVFLDVVSWSRNSKGKTDVLPLSTSRQVEVKPRLGEIVLLVNGVNVSNLQSLKINPSIGKMGIILDATASRATGGSIVETTWDFWNQNTISYKWSPIVERQLYINQWVYPVKLSFKTNNWQVFNKEFQLIVRDPAAVVQTDKEVGYVWDEIHFSAVSYFTNAANVEYSWQIQDESNKKILKSSAGNTLNYKFQSIGKYIVSLTTRNPNGGIDTDSRVITIESREPVANLDMPKSVNSEKPNTIIFDASKSYDPDTMSRKWLTYTWRLDGQKINLENPSDNESKWTLTFDSVGSHTISLTVANAYGKVTTTERTFEVTSILSANILITPVVAPIGTPITLIGQSPNADFFDWDMGDWSARINGNKRIIQHTFNKTGIYTVTLTVSKQTGGPTNQVQRKVYVTDTNNPFALINISNGSNTAYEDPQACEKWATVINRYDSTTFDGSKSINIDGSASDLTYTWNYFGKTKTTASLSEKFTDIGCFPIKLTVRSNKNGATHTTTQYVSIRNSAPELTSISTNVDVTKKDSQKVLVKVTANWAKDPDWVITSYIWYYTTESDKEPQNIQITQKNDITFILPNITEKYYFGVILEDNDGARTNSMSEWSEQAPLILDNENGNIYMPLISLTTPKNAILAWENIHFSATSKTIAGTVVKNAEYAWDFDGDGKFDERTSTPSVDHIYKTPGTYTMKVRVTNNWVSNTKYSTVYVKNALKAKTLGYKLPSWEIYLVNASQGSYDTAVWNIESESTESLYSLPIASGKLLSTSGVFGKLTVSTVDNDVSTVDISHEDLMAIQSTGSGLQYQSFPEAKDDTIHIGSSSEKILLSLLGNTDTTAYAIDTDTRIDSDLDGIPDNDRDNKETSSYTDGKAFVIWDFSDVRVWEREIKITLLQGNTPKASKTLKIVFDYIVNTQATSDSGSTDFSGSMSAFDREKLDTLGTLIREAEWTDRALLMKEYNILIENWDDAFSKAKSLINIQESINNTTLSSEKKQQISQTIDALLVWDAVSTDEVTLATKLIDSLIPISSPNREVILQKLSAISSHPSLLEENKILGKEILELVKDDTTIEDAYKIHIKNQLLIIINGGQSSIPSSEVTPTEDPEAGGGILGFIKGFVLVFMGIIGVIIIVILIWYIFYRLSRKNEDMWFQDFLIDSVFHTQQKDSPKTSWATATKTEDGNSLIVNPTVSSVSPVEVQKEKIDPLKSYTVADPLEQSLPTVTPTVLDTPPSGESTIPDWLKAPTVNTPESVSTESSPSSVSSFSSEDPILTPSVEETLPSMDDTASLSPNSLTTLEETPENIPDWLKATTESTQEQDNTMTLSSESSWEEASEEAPESPIVVENTDENRDTETVPTPESAPSEPVPASSELPDWLVNSVKTQESGSTPEFQVPSDAPKKRAKKPKKTEDEVSAPPVTDTSSSPAASTSEQNNLPDWLK